MANNKVVYGNTPLIDLTTDTATAENVVYGTSFMGSNGVIQTGTMQASGATVSGANISIAGKTYQPPSWATGTPEDIATFLDLHYSGRFSNIWGFWNEGQEREIELSDGTTVTYIIKHGSYSLVNSIQGTSTSAFIIEPKYITHSSIYGNSTGSRITWSASTLRNYVNNTLYNFFPTDFKGLLKQFVSPLETQDYFFVPEDSMGIMTNPEGTAQRYWLTSYPSNYSAYENYVTTSGTITNMAVSSSNSAGVYAIGAI